MSKTLMRSCEIVQNVSGPLPSHDINDWPAQMQDAIYAALERRRKADGVNWIISNTRADIDPDTGPYVHVIAVAFMAVQ